MVKSGKKLKTLKKLKTKMPKKTGKKQKKTKGKRQPKTKLVKKQANNKASNNKKASNNTKNSILTTFEQKPVVLYSKNPLTGEETLVQTQQINGDKFKSFAMKSESQIPPTVYKSNNGSTTFSMSKKRQMVVQSYSIGNKQ